MEEPRMYEKVGINAYAFGLLMDIVTNIDDDIIEIAKRLYLKNMSEEMPADFEKDMRDTIKSLTNAAIHGIEKVSKPQKTIFGNISTTYDHDKKMN